MGKGLIQSPGIPGMASDAGCMIIEARSPRQPVEVDVAAR
mgnify:CR=1 FL=1